MSGHCDHDEARHHAIQSAYKACEHECLWRRKGEPECHDQCENALLECARVPTTCLVTDYGMTRRLSFQIKVF